MKMKSSKTIKLLEHGLTALGSSGILEPGPLRQIVRAVRKLRSARLQQDAKKLHEAVADISRLVLNEIERHAHSDSRRRV